MPDATQIENATQFPRIFYAKHMQPGLVGYENETIYVDLDAIKAMLPSGVGKPVYIEHQDVDLKNIHKADGYVTDAFYNEADGWAWFKILAVDDEAHKAIANGWSVSNAYIPHAWGEAGMQNNCKYDRKMLGGEFTHLAIVPNPRYEEACIMTPDEFKVYQAAKKAQYDELKNSKTELPPEQNAMLKFFRKSKEEITNASEITEDSFVEFQGRQISVKQLNEILNAKKNDMNEEMKKDDDKKDKKEDKENESECYDIDGEKVTMNDLKETWKASKKNEKKNKKNDYDDKAKDEEEDEKENDTDDENDASDDGDDMDAMDNKKKKNEKKNSNDKKHFNELRNAHLNGAQQERNVVQTMDEKLARGKALFSK